MLLLLIKLLIKALFIYVCDRIRDSARFIKLAQNQLKPKFNQGFMQRTCLCSLCLIFAWYLGKFSRHIAAHFIKHFCDFFFPCAWELCHVLQRCLSTTVRYAKKQRWILHFLHDAWVDFFRGGTPGERPFNRSWSDSLWWAVNIVSAFKNKDSFGCMEVLQWRLTEGTLV